MQEAPLLVGLLGSVYEKTQKLAAKALWSMVKENPETETVIAKAGGGAEALVHGCFAMVLRALVAQHVHLRRQPADRRGGRRRAGADRPAG